MDIVDFTVILQDLSGQPVTGAIVLIHAHAPSEVINPTVRNVDAGSANFYHGPPMADCLYDVTAWAGGYSPRTTGETPIVFGQHSATVTLTLPRSFKLPTRAQACSIRRHFQGLTIQSQQYGPLPWFVAALISFESEVDALLDQLIAAGDTHCQIDLFWDYGEPGQPWGSGQIVPPRDLSNDLPRYVAIVDRVMARGLIPVYGVFGEGGPQWIRAHFQELVDALRVGRDRTRWGPFYVVYDGGWPAAWSVQDVKDTLPFMRAIIGDEAYLGMMFGRGPAGNPYFFVEDEGDYGKPWMQCLDFVMMSTGPDQAQCPSLVNGMQYLLGPALQPQGTCTPEWHGPWLMAPGTPRGPYFAGFDEWDEYRFVRGQVSVAQIVADQARMDTVGIVNHG